MTGVFRVRAQDVTLSVWVATVGESPQSAEREDAAVVQVAEQQADGVASDVHVFDDLDVGWDIVYTDAAYVRDLVDALSARAVAAHVAVGHEGFETVGPNDV